MADRDLSSSRIRERSELVLKLSIVAFADGLDPCVIQGGKNRRRGKNENDDDKRELVFREDGQGE